MKYGSGELCMNEQTEKPASLPSETGEPAPHNGAQAAEDEEITAAQSIKSVPSLEDATNNDGPENDGDKQGSPGEQDKVSTKENEAPQVEAGDTTLEMPTTAETIQVPVMQEVDEA